MIYTGSICNNVFQFKSTYFDNVFKIFIMIISYWEIFMNCFMKLIDFALFLFTVY